MAGAVSLDRLLGERVERQGEVAVSSGDVLRWSEAHRVRAPRHWPGLTADWVAPPAMVTSFLRPMEWRPDREGRPGDRGSTLHEELKAALGLPLGIAAGYDLELHGLLRDGDRVAAVERIASVGEPETSRLGPGRRWVIENEIRRVGAAAGELVAIERFHMLGYDPEALSDPEEAESARPGGSVRDPRGDVVNHGAEGAGPEGPDRVEELDVTALGIVMGASANRVWTPAHVDRDAANAAGIADVFLDTSTQLGLLSGVAERAVGPDARPGRLSLRMRRPILPGQRLRMEAAVTAVDADRAGPRWATVEVLATVDGRVHSSLEAWIAAAGPVGGPADPWLLAGPAWSPVGDDEDRYGSQWDG
jgi:hypothetical protein